jgi:hypothetical protein
MEFCDTCLRVSRSSAGGIVTRLQTARSGVRMPVGARDVCLQNVKTSSGDHPASYPMGNGDSFRQCKADGS